MIVLSEKYKYQFTIQQEDVAAGKSSHAQLLKMILPNSTVLECGPAHGVMTKYMKEVLHCKVSIVEVDQESYADALQYAVGGVCANIEDDVWMDQFECGHFDYILYADVLEHLRDPQAVLVKMKKFLKPDGSVLLSVPNIAHGDIIMNLLCDQFNYTPLGLLDNTHIHFFTYKSLRKMIADAGYFLSDEYARRANLFATEQGVFLPKEQRADLLSALSSHTTANILQFICRLTLTETELKSDILTVDSFNIPCEARSNFYFDIGSGFSVESAGVYRGQISDDGHIVFDVSLPEGCVAVRYDPVEGYPCIVREGRASADGKWLRVVPLNGFLMGEMAIFQDSDPQMLIAVPTGSRKLHLEVFIMALSCGNRLGSSKVAMHIFREAQRLLTEKDTKLEEKKQKIREKEQEIREKEQKLQTELNRSKEILKNREQHCMDIERQLQDTHKKLIRCSADQQKATEEIKYLRDFVKEIQEAYNQISNSFFWKISKPLRWLLDKIKGLHR